jgi:RNA recognition motif-containing protein
MSSTNRNQIYVGGLPGDIKISELKEDFGKFGKIF